MTWLLVFVDMLLVVLGMTVRVIFWRRHQKDRGCHGQGMGAAFDAKGEAGKIGGQGGRRVRPAWSGPDVARLSRLGGLSQGGQLHLNLGLCAVDLGHQLRILRRQGAVLQQLYRGMDGGDRDLMRDVIGEGADRRLSVAQRIGHGDDAAGGGMQFLRAEMDRRRGRAVLFDRQRKRLQHGSGRRSRRTSSQPSAAVASKDCQPQHRGGRGIAQMRPQPAQRHQPGERQPQRAAERPGAKARGAAGAAPSYHRPQEREAMPVQGFDGIEAGRLAPAFAAGCADGCSGDCGRSLTARAQIASSDRDGTAGDPAGETLSRSGEQTGPRCGRRRLPCRGTRGPWRRVCPCPRAVAARLRMARMRATTRVAKKGLVT